MEDHTEYVEYAEDEPTTGQIYLKFDAAAVDKLVIVKETSNNLHPLEQDEDANYDSGVYEIQLCTFTATTTALTDVTQTFPIAEGSVDVLDSLTDIMANTDLGKAAGALAVKELNTNLVNNLGMPIRVNSVTNEPEWKDVGADTWHPFNSNFALLDNGILKGNAIGCRHYASSQYNVWTPTMTSGQFSRPDTGNNGESILFSEPIDLSKYRFMVVIAKATCSYDDNGSGFGLTTRNDQQPFSKANSASGPDAATKIYYSNRKQSNGIYIVDISSYNRIGYFYIGAWRGSYSVSSVLFVK